MRGRVVGTSAEPGRFGVTWRVTVLATLVVLLAPCGAGAQEAPARLTLEDALAIARDRSPAYRRAVVRADAAGAGVREAIGAFLPSLTGQVNFAGISNTRVTGEDNFGRPVRLADPVTFNSSSASQGLSSQLTLFDGFQNINTLRAARASADALRAAEDLSGIAVEAEVTRRFYDALQAGQLIRVEERLLDVARDQLVATERLFQVAARSQVDVLGAEASVAQQEQALETARGDARKARLLLAEQMGLDEFTEFAVEGELPEPFDPAGLSPDGLVAAASGISPRLAQARADALQSDFAASAARGRRWPTVSASAGFNRSTSRQGFDALFEFNPLNRGFNFNVGFTVPIFTRFQTSRIIADAAAGAVAGQENLRQTRLEVERGVRAALIDVGTAYRRLELAQRSLDLSRRRLAMAQEQYQLGTIDFIEFQQIVNAAAQDERQVLNAEVAFAKAGVNLEELVGQRIRP